MNGSLWIFGIPTPGFCRFGQIPAHGFHVLRRQVLGNQVLHIQRPLGVTHRLKGGLLIAHHSLVVPPSALEIRLQDQPAVTA